MNSKISVFITIGVFITGCAQDTKSISPQTQQQPQEQASLGRGGDSDIVYNLYDHSVNNFYPTSQPSNNNIEGDTAGATLAGGGPGRSLVVVTNVQTGGTSTPNQVGGNPTATGTTSQEATLRPQVQTNPALALGAPGSAPNATTNTGGMEASPANQTATNTPTINYTKLEENIKAGVAGASELLAQLVKAGDPKAVALANKLMEGQ